MENSQLMVDPNVICFQLHTESFFTNSKDDLKSECSPCGGEMQLLRSVLEDMEVNFSNDIEITADKLIEIFSKYAAKRELRKTVLAFLASDSKYFTTIVRTSLRNIFENVNTELNLYVPYCQHLVYFIDTCLPVVKEIEDDIVQDVLRLCLMLLNVYLCKKRSLENCDFLSSLINSSCRLILSLYSKNASLEYPQIAAELLKYSFEVVTNDDIEFDLRKKCGLIFVSSFYKIPAEEKEKILKENSITLLGQKFSSADSISFVHLLLDVEAPQSIKTILYTSVYSVVDTLDVYGNKLPIITSIFHLLVDSATKVTSITEEIVEVSKTLHQMTKYFPYFKSDEFVPVFNRGLSHVWAFIEHSVHFVRNYTKEMFVSLVETASRHYKNGDDDCINILLSKIKSTTKISNVYFIALESLTKFLETSFVLKHIPDAAVKLMKLIYDFTIGQQATNAYIGLMKNHYNEIPHEDWISVWIKPVVISLRTSNPPITERLEHIIISGCRVFPKMLHVLFPQTSMEDMKDIATLLKCLHFTRQMEYNEQNQENSDMWRGLIHKSKLDLFAIHQNDQIRLSVLSIIIESKKTTELYTDYDTEFLKKYLKYNIAAGVPSTKKQMIALYKKALARFDAGHKVITRGLANSKNRNNFELYEQYKQNCDLYDKFISGLIKDLISNLFPGANFPRRSTSLELLLSAETCVSSEKWYACWERHDIDNLFSILHDSYESNKIMALELLNKFSLEKIGFDDRENTLEYFEKCCELACDIKPINTLSAAYMFLAVIRSHYVPLPSNVDVNENASQNGRILATQILLEKLSDTLKESSDILIAASSKPLHGILLCLHHLLKSRNKKQCNEIYQKIFITIADLSKTILDIVNPIICDQSPEGYLPKSDNILDNVDQTSTAQMILFYAWRTMKELTLLLSEIIIQTCQVKESTLLSIEYIHSLLEEFISIFLQSKHRGVFEHSFVGFSAICETFWRSDLVIYNELPKKWLSRTLNYCIGKEKSSNLCATRRSAGLPFLLLSIVTTYPHINKGFMDEIMVLLMDGSENSDSETRTHCLNTLRAVFRNTKLGDHVLPYVASAVKNAILGFKSPSWNVRNSSTLLYSALIVRIFGVQRTQDPDDVTMKNKLTLKVFIMRYPGLLDFLFETLTEECKLDKGRSLLLHPILLILSRLCPSNVDDLIDKEKYVLLIRDCFSHPIYKTRELAAKASLAFLSEKDIQLTIEENFKMIFKKSLTNNTCSGYLLQTIHLLKRSCPSDSKVINECIESSLHILNDMGIVQKDLIITLYMDALRRLLLSTNVYIKNTMLLKIMKLVSRKEENQHCFLMRYTYNKYRLLLLLVVSFKAFRHSVALYNYIKRELLFYLCSGDEEIKRFSLKLLICLSQNLFKDILIQHPLLEYEQVEIPTEIVEVLNAVSNSSKLALYLQVYNNVVHYCHIFLKNMESANEDLTESLLLCYYYPCFISCQNNTLEPSEVFESLLAVVHKGANDEVVSAVLSCLEVFLLKSNEIDKKKFDMESLIHVLKDFSPPTSPEYLRLAICNFLRSFGLLKFRECQNVKDEELCDIFNVIMTLLEDDDLEIRNAISHINIRGGDSNSYQFDPVPELAREELIELSLELLPKSLAVGFIIAWSTKAFEVEDNNLSEIFDRSELNQYADSVATVKTAAPILREAIWQNLNMSEADIRQNILAGTYFIIMSLETYMKKMLGHETLIELEFVLTHLVTFTENCDKDKDMRSELRLFLSDKIRGFFVRHSSYNHSIMNYLLLEIYKPVVTFY